MTARAIAVNPRTAGRARTGRTYVSTIATVAEASTSKPASIAADSRASTAQLGGAGEIAGHTSGICATTSSSTTTIAAVVALGIHARLAAVVEAISRLAFRLDVSVMTHRYGAAGHYCSCCDDCCGTDAGLSQHRDRAGPTKPPRRSFSTSPTASSAAPAFLPATNDRLWRLEVHASGPPTSADTVSSVEILLMATIVLIVLTAISITGYMRTTSNAAERTAASAERVAVATEALLEQVESGAEQHR